MQNSTDVLVIGSGLAGLALALKMADQAEVTILSKAPNQATNTSLAQGGIAAVSDQHDTVSSHVEDTLEAGAGLCHPEVVESFIAQGPARIRDLINWGVHFDQVGNDYDLTREGGHQARRIFHHADQTGWEIHSALLKKAKDHPRIRILENQLAIEIITTHTEQPKAVGPKRALGAYVLDKTTGTVNAYLARATVLATGGAGKVYLYTSNWPGATGDGIALAFRAGARVANLEFMQFHPTCLYHPSARNFLISEALRGEGGILRDRAGVAFMEGKHRMSSLAPRDIVARSIDEEMKKSGDVCVFLDMTHLDKDFIIKRFPAIHAKCLEYGIDMTKQPIPVVPAAHYLCGGVLTDVNGQTDVEGLFSVGETACTGFHGANRLASNSLLECVAMAHNLSEKLRPVIKQLPLAESAEPWSSQDKPDADELVIVAHSWDEIRRLMWNYVGIVRSNRRLLSAERRLATILDEVQDYERRFKLHSDLVELRNLALVAALTVKCALQRHESRGIHYSLDYPEVSPIPRDSVLDALDL